MGTVSIKKGSAKLSTFMGYTMDESYDFGGQAHKAWFKKGIKVYDAEIIPYHSSWDWLMEVWFKFRDLEYKNWDLHQHRNFKKRIVIAITQNNHPKYAFNELCEAIDWHNLNVSQDQPPINNH